MHDLSTIAPAFVEMAHRIVWAVVATTRPDGTPASRVLHPIWAWDGTELQGWIATDPASPKARHLADTPWMSLTYWDATQDTCTADCSVEWVDLDGRRDAWRRFEAAPPPLGFDPTMIPGWTAPDAPRFGVVRLRPDRLRVMPGSLPTTGEGTLMTWRRTT